MMRLLANKPDGGFTLHKFKENEALPPYAALSHTWLEEDSEVTYHDLISDKYKEKAGYNKLKFCGDRAAKDGLDYFWADTCCINKHDALEHTSAINCMFRWYQRATKCYAYLSDVHVSEEGPDAQAVQMKWDAAFRGSRWFTRGWTLQELLAPVSVEFFSANGKLLGSKMTLETTVHDITKIPTKALLNYDLHGFKVEERVKWSESRKTTVPEDGAYCLLGIFGLFLPLIYGEGEDHAFRRLNLEIERVNRLSLPVSSMPTLHGI